MDSGLQTDNQKQNHHHRNPAGETVAGRSNNSDGKESAFREARLNERRSSSATTTPPLTADLTTSTPSTDDDDMPLPDAAAASAIAATTTTPVTSPTSSEFGTAVQQAPPPSSTTTTTVQCSSNSNNSAGGVGDASASATTNDESIEPETKEVPSSAPVSPNDYVDLSHHHSAPTTSSNNSNSSTDRISADTTTTATTTADADLVAAAANVRRLSGNGGRAFVGDDDPGEHAEDIAPLVPKYRASISAASGAGPPGDASSKPRKPRSIVKSPSNRSFGCAPAGGSDESAPLTAEPRPVLHVKFHHHPNGGIGGTDDRSPDGSTPASSVSSTSSSSSSSSSSLDDEEGSSSGQYSEARPPDGGWGWVVVFASFIINLIADGITFSFGVIYVEFLAYFGEGKGKTAWIGSLFMAMPLLSGPIASFLTDRYGCRKVTIVGSILACLGFVLSAFSTSMEMLFLTFGILAGFGLSLCYVAAVVIVAYYFDKRRSFATGLSVCGSGIGTFIFAPLTQYLIEAYGWRGTTLILAGFFLNMTVCGMLMRDLEWTTHRAKLKAKERKQRSGTANRLGVSADSFSVSNSTNTGGTASNLHQQQQQHAAEAELYGKAMDAAQNPRLFSSLITLPTYMRNGEKVSWSNGMGFTRL